MEKASSPVIKNTGCGGNWRELDNHIPPDPDFPTAGVSRELGAVGTTNVAVEAKREEELPF
jgi:hypothetical protein